MHWNGIRHILRYLHGTTNIGLFYSNGLKLEIVSYGDASYLSEPHKVKSQHDMFSLVVV